MLQMRIKGKEKLTGTIKISGAKNSAVAIIPAALLSDGLVTIDNVPDISDIDSLTEILNHLEIDTKRENDTIIIDPTKLVNKEIPEKLSKKLRASYYFMGALLGKYKKAYMYFPGGCSIGKRPINLHLKGFEALGATISEENNFYKIEAKELKGSHIYLDVASVGATINIMLAATKAKGKTIIENAAKEPEIVNIATFLNQMGAKITGAGTGKISIIGVEHLNGCFSEIIPDRIEAGTYTILGALTGDKLKIDNIIPEHIESLIMKLKEMKIPLEINTDHLIISANPLAKAISIKTLGYPGFPTDLQQPLTTLLTTCNGKSTVHETIYENRFQNVEYLNQMGADIKIDNDKIFINGPTQLIGKEVVATDLRAGACLILAGLIAEGETVVKEIEHVLRGYENIVTKLEKIGAKIKIEEI